MVSSRRIDCEQKKYSLNFCIHGIKVPTLDLVLEVWQRGREIAFVPIVDGSADNFILAREAGLERDIPFLDIANTLHYFGSCGYLGSLLSVKGLLRLIQNGVRIEKVPGQYRETVSTSFEYGTLLCSHPGKISLEMEALGRKVDSEVQKIREGQYDGAIDTSSLRRKMADSRFSSGDNLKSMSDRDILVTLYASEIQRIIAYIHPWYERVGRTSEEVMMAFFYRCGGKPLSLSSPVNRCTLEGYERGIALSMTAIGVLREISRRFGISEGEVQKLYSMSDFYASISDGRLGKTIYRSVLKYYLGQNVFPNEGVMDKYFCELDNIVMNLIEGLNAFRLIEDPATIYLASHLVGRGKLITIPNDITVS